MVMMNRLYFVEELGDNQYTFRYGGHVFVVAFEEHVWCLVRENVRTPLQGDNLHDALYHVVSRLQHE